MASGNGPQYDLSDAPALFEKFIKDYNRNYKDDADKAVHYEAFVKTLKKVNEANAKQSSATFDINKFADYTPEESKNLFGFKSKCLMSLYSLKYSAIFPLFNTEPLKVEYETFLPYLGLPFIFYHYKIK